MSDHPNAARYRAVMQAAQDGATEGFADAIADDVVWWEIGATEPIRGKEALVTRMQDWDAYGISAELHDVVSNDDHLIALLNVTANRDGEPFSYQTAEIMHINAAGQVTERWAFSGDTAAIVAYFS